MEQLFSTIFSNIRIDCNEENIRYDICISILKKLFVVMVPTHLRSPPIQKFLAPPFYIYMYIDSKKFTSFLKSITFKKKIKNDLPTHPKNLGSRYCKHIFFMGCLSAVFEFSILKTQVSCASKHSGFTCPKFNVLVQINNYYFTS